MKPVLMIGEGAWGTAMATVFAHNGIPVKLWCNDPQVAKDIINFRENKRYLPGIVLSSLIEPLSNLEEIDNQTEYVFISTPLKYFRVVLTQCKKWYSPDQIWVVLSKGIENDSLLLPTQILRELFGQDVKAAVMVGPSFAHEVANKQLTAVNLGADNHQILKKIQTLVQNNYFRIFFNDDVIGMQVCAALKNVIALGFGILDGAGYGENAKALFLTQGLSEIACVVDFLGGKKETLYGLSGLGDMVLTATSMQSRNTQVGRAIGQGRLLRDILKETGYTPEGVNTAYSVAQLIKKLHIPAPICQVIWQLIEGKATVDQLKVTLMESRC